MWLFGHFLFKYFEKNITFTSLDPLFNTSICYSAPYWHLNNTRKLYDISSISWEIKLEIAILPPLLFIFSLIRANHSTVVLVVSQVIRLLVVRLLGGPYPSRVSFQMSAYQKIWKYSSLKSHLSEIWYFWTLTCDLIGLDPGRWEITMV